MWKFKDCKGCKYRVRERCRFNPPLVINANSNYMSLYPKVADIRDDGDVFSDACSHYAEEVVNGFC